MARNRPQVKVYSTTTDFNQLELKMRIPASRKYTERIVGTLITLVFGGCALFGVHPVSHLKQAEAFRSEGNYQSAIDEYRLHIDERLKDEKRDKDENPSFYYLLIGDCYLAASEPIGAKENFDKAKKDDVSKDLVVDRYKQLARFYESKSDFNAGITTLREIRCLDPMIVDFEIDRIYKASLNAEDEKEKQFRDQPTD